MDSQSSLPIRFRDSPPLLGRDAARDSLVYQLLENRQPLIHLLGPGGVGKTRLAAVVFQSLHSLLAQQVYFIELAGLTSLNQVHASIMRTLGVRESITLPPDVSIATAIGDRRVLLILDNIEHLQDIDVLVLHLLHQCPNLQVLTTGRVTLDIARGLTYFVEPIDLDSAVALFLQSARSISPAMTADTTIVEQICKTLDGLPLAIELAAAQIAHLPLSVLARKLLQAQRLLLDPQVSELHAPAPTMVRAIKWSVDLLSPEEQMLLFGLSQFSDSFTIQAVEAIGQVVDETGSLATTRRFATLVNSSLISPIHEGEGRGRRYRMLSTIREYCRRELGEIDRASTFRAAYVQWFVRSFCESLDTSPLSNTWFDEIERDIGNLPILFDILMPGDVETCLSLVTSLHQYWIVRGSLKEGREYTERVLATEEGTIHARAKASVALAWILLAQGTCDESLAMAEVAMELSEISGNLHCIADSCHILSTSLLVLSGEEYAPRLSLFEQATIHSERNLQICRTLSDGRRLGMAFHAAGDLYYKIGDSEQAITYLNSALRQFQEVFDRRSFAWTLTQLSLAFHESNRIVEAIDSLRSALVAFMEENDRWSLGHVFRNVGRWTAQRGDYENAIRMLANAAYVHHGNGVNRDGMNDPEIRHYFEIAAETLHESGFQSVVQSAQSMTFSDSIHLALRLLDNLQGDQATDDPQDGILQTLTRREREVLDLLITGLSDREIGGHLFISTRTVNFHLGNLLSKFGVSSRNELTSVVLRSAMKDLASDHQPPLVNIGA